MSDGSPRDIVLSNEILRGVVGSMAHGTALSGHADRDEMGVFIEPPSFVCGLEALDGYEERIQPEGLRSEPGDLELTMYSLRRFCRLAMRGNPTALFLLWLPSYVTMTPAGAALIGIRTAFVSRTAGERFLGYLKSQKQRMSGERGRNVRRPELVAAYGYDTKFAMHALRLGYEGIALMEEGELPVPVPEVDILRAVRQGEVSYPDVILLISEVEARLRRSVDACVRTADRLAVDAFLVDAHLRHWEVGRG